MKQHNGEKLFSCYECSQKFPGVRSRNHHIKAEETWREKPFVCDQCIRLGGKSYACDHGTKSFASAGLFTKQYNKNMGIDHTYVTFKIVENLSQ